MLRKDAVNYWMNLLASAGHYIEPETALTIANWWDDRRGPLVLEGPPGGGKTELAKRIAQKAGTAFYRLSCSKSISANQALYSWNSRLQDLAIDFHVKQHGFPTELASIIYKPEFMVKGALAQALDDSSEHVVLLIDELDKVPSEENFEGVLLEFLAEAAITVPEMKRRIVSSCGKAPHTIITSNAGTSGLDIGVKNLSHPVLRRGKYVYLPEAACERQFKILCEEAPGLPQSLIRDCVIIAVMIRLWVDLKKPLALSETEMWVRSLQLANATHMNVELLRDLVSDLAKGQEDQIRFLAAVERLINQLPKFRQKNFAELDSILEQQRNPEKAKLKLRKVE